VAGLIKADDVAQVKERSSIEDVVREHVTLRSAGPGSLKGLCPFHDEKSPSFNVRPATGAWHCFGCGEGGDVISFVQRVEHLTFAESVERLAAKLGMELRYEEGGGPRSGEGLGKRSRLVEAHRVAAEYYCAALVNMPEARLGRDFLRERGFDRMAADKFGVGFSPRGGEDLTKHLRGKGFSDDEIVAGGLAGRGGRGLYDRFRGRLMWPIHDITGDVVGFGARRLFDDDRIEAKYLNTSETSIYKKSFVLYGLDMAKKAIARDRQAVVVEGYTDVMACHLAGVETAVATCGTAFGVEHIKVLRRIMRDENDLAPAKVVFTFDGDAAGQKAAMRAFGEDQRWASQSFVAVEASGKDPCELRQAGGDAAIRALIDDAVPMFEFAVRTTLARFDLSNAEGRVRALEAVAPIVAGIRDRSLRPEYTRTVAGWLGVEVEQVANEVGRATRMATRAATATSAAATGTAAATAAAGSAGSAGTGSVMGSPARQVDSEPGREQGHERGDGHGNGLGHEEGHEHAFEMARPDLRDPVVSAERQLLQAALQFPSLIDPAGFEAIAPESFSAPAHRAVHDAIRAAGGIEAAGQPGLWVDRVSQAASLTVRPLVSELAVASVPARFDKTTGLPERRYVDGLLIRIQEVALTRQIGDAISAMRRVPPDETAASRALGIQLQDLQRELADLRAKLG
jgi:DNA primase